MDSGREAFPFTPSVRNWLQSFAFEPLLDDGVLWIPTDDVRLGLRRVDEGEWEVVRSERGSAPRRLMRARAEHAERYLVWESAIAAQWTLQRRSDAYPTAPVRIPAPDGSIAVEDGDVEVRVIVDGEVVARFERGFVGRGDAVSFTYYCRLPAPLLVEQIMGPADAMAFPAGARHRSGDEEAVVARRVQDATREALHRWQRPARERRELELRALQRSPGLPIIRMVRQRLRYCSFVTPPPKEAQGDSLQVAFRVDDAAGEKQLLAALLLAPRQYDETQRVRFGGKSIEVTVETGTAWLTGAGEPRTERLVLLRLWNREHLYDVTPELVDRAARLEQHFDELGLVGQPRETDLFGFVTAERYPELFDDR